MSDPVTEFDKYHKELLEALGNKDPLQVLQETIDEIQQLIKSQGVNKLKYIPAPHEWSPWQVLTHLADNDQSWGMRIRMIATQDRPRLIGFDQEAMTARFGTLDPNPKETLTRWIALRKFNIEVLKSLTPAEWNRVGLHNERGVQSIQTIVQLAAGHDRIHLKQLRRGLLDTNV